MRAVVRDRYGPPEVLELRELPLPELTDDGVLVRVRASSVNPAEWYAITGPPMIRVFGGGMLKPKRERLGADFAGVVEAVGKDVADFQPGDEVFGGSVGAFAEYICARNAVSRKPANVSFDEAGVVATAATTALQGLRDHGELRPGQKVLVNGASGGVGTYAVQIAKALGAEVTAVCSTAKVNLVRSLGADEVVDYTREDFTRLKRRYDLVFDVAGSRSWSEYRRVLEPHGILVLAGQSRRPPKSNRFIGPLPYVAKMILAGRLRGSQKVKMFIAKFNKADMDVLRDLLESGRVRSVIDRRYELADIGDAFRYLADGHAAGKVAVTV